MLVLLTDELSSVLVRGQLSFLLESGFEVFVGTRTGQTDGSSAFDPGVQVHHIDFIRQPSPGADIRALWQTIRLIRRLHPDIVHASTPKAGLLGMVAARLCRTRVRVFQARGLRYETAHGIRRRVMCRFDQVSMACATDVVFNSRSSLDRAEQDHLIASGRASVLGSGQGVDADHFSPIDPDERRRHRTEFGLPLDARVIVSVGRLTKDKGIDDLVHAYTELHDDSAWLFLVGTFEDGDRIASSTLQLIQDHPRIVHRPWMTDTRAAYATADVLAFPSYREGLPNAPLQAQACGVPVVGYAATGTVDAVVDGETGILVPTGDRTALCEALRRVLDDSDLRSRLANSGRGYVVAEFQPRVVWDRVAQLYRRALAR